MVGKEVKSACNGHCVIMIVLFSNIEEKLPRTVKIVKSFVNGEFQTERWEELLWPMECQYAWW